MKRNDRYVYQNTRSYYIYLRLVKQISTVYQYNYSIKYPCFHPVPYDMYLPDVLVGNTSKSVWLGGTDEGHEKCHVWVTNQVCTCIHLGDNYIYKYKYIADLYISHSILPST